MGWISSRRQRGRGGYEVLMAGLLVVLFSSGPAWANGKVNPSSHPSNHEHLVKRGLEITDKRELNREQKKTVARVIAKKLRITAKAIDWNQVSGHQGAMLGSVDGYTFHYVFNGNSGSKKKEIVGFLPRELGISTENVVLVVDNEPYHDWKSGLIRGHYLMDPFDRR